MNRTTTFEKLTSFGIIPIIRTTDGKKAGIVAEALRRSGICVLEISLSTSNGLAILEKLADRFGDTILLGAGTVLGARAARDAFSAGARFIVSPGISLPVIKACKQMSTVVCPGALTPTEIMHAWQLGADAIKVFPCDAAGGPRYIRSILAPLPHLNLLPCGGVTHGNAAEYFSAGAAALFVGSSLVSMNLPGNKLPEAVERSASRFIHIVNKARKILK
jgi:2-dehydro-3-deoxyphosphogluconate aldolase/(4S)-4-hydroxy-2-oxoglutarate aldolase